VCTLQGTNISHLGTRKIIFKYALLGGYVNFLEGNDPQFLEDFHFINQVDEASEAGKTAESIFKRLKAAG